MRKGILFFVFVLIAIVGFAQPKDIRADSPLWRDTIFKPDIDILASQIYNIRQQLLDVPLADSVYSILEPKKIALIEELDSLYIEEILDKKRAYQKNTLRYKRRMQAYSYLATDLALDIFFYCPETYKLFVNPAFKGHPFGWDKERDERAFQILENLKMYLDTVDPEHLTLMLKLVEELKSKEVSTAKLFMKGSPTQKETYDHDLIDALLLATRLAYE